ncbi:hypothetical protein [Mesorhizobium sp.]|uniref:hypothetical protein n=1 Tax=Mesorhizobium sp. TaxID=1871066 RepID=UPI0025F2191F|nr:hypothetical protein [Mesorhizobium sp.]
MEEVPWADSITVYDKENFTIYRQILDACADNASLEEMAEQILGIDPSLNRSAPTRLFAAISTGRTGW